MFSIPCIDSIIDTAFEIAGFQIDKIELTFEGQYMWIEASIAKNTNMITKKPNNIEQLTNDFSKLEQDICNKWKTSLKKFNLKGKVALWGAGAKGATFANLSDENCILIDSIIDINLQKQEKYIPGTGHMIINPNQIQKRGIKTIIIMNPNYYSEILNLVNTLDVNIDLISKID